MPAVTPSRRLEPLRHARRRLFARICPQRNDRGFTLIECAILFAVMSVGLMAGLALLNRGAAESETATTKFLVEDRARGALSGAFDILAETSIRYVDTGMRIHGPVAASDVFSDRFTIPGLVLRQCTSPTCTFHTRDDLTVHAREFNCGYEYCTGLPGGPVARGKNWPAAATSCPLDGAPLSTIPRLDGVKFFLARDETGAFSKLPDGRPRWEGLVFLFPCVSPDGMCELRRYDVYVSDLLANPPSYSTGFNRFDPVKPSMIDLFDFGKDGTTNGIPDKKVPLTNATSDATSEVFTTGTYLGDPTILVSKALGTPGGGTYPQRSLTLRVNLLTGETSFSVEHHDSATAFWTAGSTFTRIPRTLVKGLTELAISTAKSHPFDAAANPTGVAETNVVRITLGTTAAPRDRANQWLNHVETFQIKSRN